MDSFLAALVFVLVVAVAVVGGAALAVRNALRLRRLEAAVARLEAGTASEAAPRMEAPATAPAAAEPAAPPSATAAARAIDWEELVAGRWLHRVGLVAVLLAAAFFLKYAFDNRWVGPAGRVAIGLAVGTALIASGQWLLGRGYRYFSEGLTALGAGVLFLALYASWGFYQLVPAVAAAAGMVAVTGLTAVLAAGRDSQRLALLSLAAGLLTPGLLASGEDHQVALFVYLLALAAAFLTLSAAKRWHWPPLLALAGWILYYLSWRDGFYDPSRLATTALLATASFLLFAGYSIWRARSRVLPAVELVWATANALFFGAVLHDLLHRQQVWALTLAVLGVAALYLLAALAAGGAAPPRAETARLLFAGLALAYATAAIPIRLEGEWLPIAWSLEGALLVWAGMRGDSRTLRLAGLGLLAVVFLLLFDVGPAGRRLVFNQRFASFAAAVAALALAARWSGGPETRMASSERRLFAAAGVAATALAVWGLSEETWRAIGRLDLGAEGPLLRQMSLSLLWIAAAVALLVAGAVRSASLWRWQGLTLMGLAVVKVFLLDLSFLERAYRIVSFLALGLVLIAVSFYYQRRATGRGDGAA